MTRSCHLQQKMCQILLYFGDTMQAHFSLERELNSQLVCKEVLNDIGPFHFHSQIELYFVDEGQIEAFVNHHRYIMKLGEMSVALSYDAHIYHAIGNTKSSLLIIPTHMCETFLSCLQGKKLKSPYIRNAQAVEKMRQCFDEIRKCTNPVSQQGYLYVILGIILDNIELEEDAVNADNSLTSKLLFYINDHFKEDIDVDSIACTLGYSTNYLSRFFKRTFRIGIPQYINFLRLRNAILLMQKGQYSHTYCALESGFNSVRTFYRAFQNEFHCSPREYFSQGNPNV